MAYKTQRYPFSVATIHGCLAAEYLTFLGVTTPPDTLTWNYAYAREYYGTASSDATIVPTYWLRNIQANDYKVPSDHMTVVPYGMDIDLFIKKMDVFSDLTAPTDKKVIVCPARLDIVKGHTYLLDALSRLKQDRNDWVCWLVGDGHMRAELEHQVKRLNLENDVQFLGSRNDVPALLEESRTFLCYQA